MIGTRKRTKNISSLRRKRDSHKFSDPMSFIVTFIIIMASITLGIFCIISGDLSIENTSSNLLGNFGDIATSILLVGSSLVAVLAYKL